jgi:tRNA threonylcarbamoyladenosine biosynthesis protein TsaB
VREPAAAAVRGLVLGIDSCTDNLGLGLIEDGLVLETAMVDSRGAHSETLLPTLASMLGRANRRAEEIALVGVTTGPGRFTSLRIGLATAQGLAFGVGAPVVPVPALEALAIAAAAGADAAGAPVAAILDAGGAGVYAAAFHVEGLAARALLAPRLEDASAFAARARAELALGGGPLFLAGSGSARAREALDAAGVPARPAPWSDLGAVVARLAVARSSEAIDPAELTPIYMRPTQAEERHAGSARILDRADAP